MDDRPVARTRRRIDPVQRAPPWRAEDVARASVKAAERPRGSRHRGALFGGREPDLHEYTLTAAGKDLGRVVGAIGEWGQRWVTAESSLGNLDPNLLMWDMRRNINTKPMPQHRSTIQVIFSDLQEARRDWWLIVEPGAEVDLCSVDPGSTSIFMSSPICGR
jgi:hypothetical protein